MLTAWPHASTKGFSTESFALWCSSDVGCCSDCRLNQGSYVNRNKDVKSSQKFTSYQDHKEDSKEKDSKHR